jgi:hypothetical protein
MGGCLQESDRKGPAVEGLIDPPTQHPCSFCQGPETPSLLCACKYYCGKDDCPNAEIEYWFRYPVPDFGGPMRKPKDEQRVVPVDVVNLEPDEYGAAINRVIAIHQACECSTCKPGHQRASCKGCSDFWPCLTIRSLRGTMVNRVGEGIAYA